MRGQLSAEMLIMLVVILAIVTIAATQLIGSAKETGENIGKQTEKLNAMTNDALKSENGDFCIVDDDCAGGSCEENRCT